MLKRKGYWKMGMAIGMSLLMTAGIAGCGAKHIDEVETASQTQTQSGRVEAPQPKEADKSVQEDRIWFYDADGDFIAVESDGHWGLIDAGERKNEDNMITDATGRSYGISWSVDTSGAEGIAWMVEHLGMDHLDFVVATHAHSDHIGGIPYVAETVGASGQPLVDDKTVYLRKPYEHTSDLNDDINVANDVDGWHDQAYWYQAEEAMKSRGAVIVDPGVGQRTNDGWQSEDAYQTVPKSINQADTGLQALEYVMGDASNRYDDHLECQFGNIRLSFYNLFTTPSQIDPNLNSIVTVADNGISKVYLGGDINTEQMVEQKVVREVVKDHGPIQIVKASHHGFDISNSKEALDLLQPKIMIVPTHEAAMREGHLAPGNAWTAVADYTNQKFGTRHYVVGKAAGPLVICMDEGVVREWDAETDGYKEADDALDPLGHSFTGVVSWTQQMNVDTLSVEYQNGTPMGF